ncbi:MAG TPA: beta-ribofuranosylaminobenzene 5'-phosphate synthase family protein [Acetobacteraceae bacterium]|nr:beta-ribofuranosylaminobenzene 5'-phosphate synthase family protein [Acetobacteraceae bacterium]
MTQAVTVSSGARLHLGFLDLNFGLGRRFGSLGLALDAPVTRVALKRAARTQVAGPEAARAGRYLDLVMAACGLRDAHALTIEAAMPAHAGLGSGTQLALAVATAVRRLHGLPPDLRADAARLGRGARSGIGVGLFAAGGLVLDGGRGARDAPPPLLARLDVPEDWRVLLLLDPARDGLSGEAERDAFAALPPMAEATVATSCRLVLMQALPAVAEADLPAFGDAITRLQRAVGDHFAPAQGGRITSPRVAAALDRLGGWGAVGLGQSSWGPTGFAFAPDPEAAHWLRDRLAAFPDAPAAMVVRPRNRGADIGMSADPH